MKSILRSIPALLAIAMLGRAQEEASSLSSETSTASVALTPARILGEIPDGTPPPPAPPKPEFRIPAQDVLNTTSHQQGGRTVTIREIKPIALPPPPAPVEPSTSEVDPEFSQRLADYRLAHPRSGLLFLGATVFHSKDSPPRTLVRYWPEGKGGDVIFWSSANFTLIAGGITTFMDAAADTHHLFMGWGSVDIDRMTEIQAAKGRKYNAPEIPEFPEGKASFQFVGELPAAEELVVFNRSMISITASLRG
jgi:hypothetical protein